VGGLGARSGRARSDVTRIDVARISVPAGDAAATMLVTPSAISQTGLAFVMEAL
jgi:hypothetical protein